MTNFEPCAAEVMRSFAKAAGGKTIEVCGGVAGFLGSAFPVNAAKGIDGKLGVAELSKICEFYGDHGADAVVELAPWVEAESLSALEQLGFEKTSEEDVMVRRSEAIDAPLEIIPDTSEWAAVLSLAFFGDVNEMGLLLGDVMQRLDSSVNIGLRENGVLVAAAQLCVTGPAGLLSGDGTVLSHRGRGLQQILIQGRIGLAHQHGLEWVHSEVLPGSTSQRNYLRCGFSRAYPRVHYTRRLSKI